MHTDVLVPLWSEETAPQQDSVYGQRTVIPEIQGHRNLPVLRNVARPALAVHRPDPGRANGTAVIVCPGGSFVTLTESGSDIAKMHVYAQVGHGFAEGSQGLPCDSWLDRYLDWLRWWGLLDCV